MSFSQITSVDLIVNQITTIVTKYNPSSAAGINTAGDAIPVETVVKTSSATGLNTKPELSNTIQTADNASRYGQTFTYTNQDGVAATSANLNSALSTTVPLSPGGSLVFDGGTQYLTANVGASTALTFGTNAFTIECWFYLTGTAGNYAIYDARTGGSVVAINLYFQGGNNLSLMVSGANQIAGGFAVTASVWHHVALSRNSGSTRLFLDGIQIGSTYTDTNSYLSGIPTIGHNAAAGGGSNFFPGYITNLRVVNGTGLYTTQFTPSITAANIANTQLLMSVSSSGTYLKDSSVNNFGFTNVGNVPYSNFVPSIPGTPAYYNTQYFSGGVNIPYGDITANVSRYTAQAYTTPGTYTWTVPAGVTSITLGAIGAGGGGVQKSAGGNGGNGGNVAYYNSYPVNPGDIYTIVVGTGGSPGAVFGNTGGSSYMLLPSSNVAAIVAPGGAGGSSVYWTNSNISITATDATAIIDRVTAADPSARAITYSISSGSLPTGASLNTSNGAITWTRQSLSSTTEYTPFTISATVSGPSQTISKQYAIKIISTAPAPTYSITSNVASLNEGNTVLYTVTTTNVANSTVLYWTNIGNTTVADFGDGLNSGTITINSNTSAFTRTLNNDLLLEGPEGIIMTLRTGSTAGPVVASASEVIVNDTSIGPTVEYLVVGGGGGGGRGNGNGGTGGQVLTGTFVAGSGSTISTSVGGGAAGGTTAALSPTGGSSSLTNGATSVTALGGAGAIGGSTLQGVGGGAAGGAASGTKNGVDGPSTAIISTTVATTYSIGQVSGGTVYFAGGGGGGNSLGGSAGVGGNGGLGGGGGGSGSQGTGGGGQPYAGGGVGCVGLVNSGAGGGGATYPNHGSAGANGVVIIRYLTTYPAATSTTGSPTYVIDGSYRVYIFTTGGSITL